MMGPLGLQRYEKTIMWFHLLAHTHKHAHARTHTQNRAHREVLLHNTKHVLQVLQRAPQTFMTTETRKSFRLGSLVT